MTTLDTLLDRNRAIAAEPSAHDRLAPSLADALPHVKAVIIGCADMRVDPALVLGLRPGEAVVMRNIGGRVTPGLLEQLGMLGAIGQAEGAVPGGGGEFNLVVMQHTDCGITRLADQTEMLATYFRTDPGQLAEVSVNDPRAAVERDVAVLRAVEALPPSWLISGLVYDVASGLAEVVVPAAPLRPQ